MKSSNLKKDKQLGMSHGKASNQLRKMILFKLVQRLGEDICYRCGEKIDTVNNFSIEHRSDWLDSKDPVGLFFDLDNISFSHQDCNSAAGRKFTGTRDTTLHGVTRYGKGCRCEICVDARREKNRRDMEKRNTHSDEFKKKNREYQKRRYNSEPEFRNNSLRRRRNYKIRINDSLKKTETCD